MWYCLDHTGLKITNATTAQIMVFRKTLFPGHYYFAAIIHLKHDIEIKHYDEAIVNPVRCCINNIKWKLPRLVSIYK